MKNKIKETIQERLQTVQASADHPRYHLAADIGWISDPNGLCEHNGEVHLFHQYTPADDKGLNKSWGHWTTKDWVRFTDEGTLMTPDSWMDKDGCYSGSGYSDGEKLHLFYTGNILEEGDHDYIRSGRGHYVNHLASKNGRDFSEKENWMKNEDYPAHMSNHVRDPKICTLDGQTYMIIGARTLDDEGCALLYTLDVNDKDSVKFVQEIHSDQKNADGTPYYGYMWECPDLFELDGKTIMAACPQGMKKVPNKIENIYQSGWFAMEGNAKDGTLKPGEFDLLDYGFDFYAPQTFEDSQKRRVLVGWMGMPDADYTNPETKDLWVHQFTLPRQMWMENGRLHQFPIEEVLGLKANEKRIDLQPGVALPLDSSVFALDLWNENKPFVLDIRHDARLIYDGKLFTLQLGESGAGRKERHVEIDSLESLSIFSDSSSLEIFLNEGEYVLSSRIYDAGKPLSLKSDTELSGSLWEMNGIELDFSKVLAD